jgi:membrane protein insertase Oxa1/YidC/SpoIIIJ
MPGAFWWIFRGEYFVPIARSFLWVNWALAGLVGEIIAVVLRVRTLLKPAD